MKNDVYDATQIPVAWRSWMAHRRPDPPTMEELLAEDRRRLAIQARAKELDLAWAEKKQHLASSKTQPTALPDTTPKPAPPPRVAHFDPRKDQYQPEEWTPSLAKRRD